MDVSIDIGSVCLPSGHHDSPGYYTASLPYTPQPPVTRALTHTLTHALTHTLTHALTQPLTH